jgi:hypothetical protein
MTEKGSTSAIALVVCAFAAAALMVVPQRASAETLVAVDTNGDVYEGALGGELESLPETEVVQAAFDGTGTLWLSISLGQGGCYLTSPDLASSEIVFDSVSFSPSTAQRTVNGCGIATAPGAALLFAGDNGSAASSAIWKLDLSSLQANLVHPGLSGATSADGRVAISQYRPSPRGLRARTRLLLGRLGQEGSIRAMVHQAPRAARDRIPGWSSPSFAPDGRMAVVRGLKNGRSQLVVGRPGGWRVVWQPGRGVAIGQTGWSADGGLLVIVGRGGGRALYFLPGGRRGSAQPLYPDVASFTLGPDRPLPSTRPELDAEAP